MICRNCQTEVDNDLIFCTNCGERLFQPPQSQPTVLMNERGATRAEAARETRPDAVSPVKKSSNLKWVALIIALVAIPASIFGVFLLRSQNRQVAVNAATPPKPPTPSPTRRANTNQNANVNANANRANTNAPPDSPRKEEVMDERIEIAPKDHYAVPFEIESDEARLKGKTTVLQGDEVEVFVYIKSEYDQYFPDPAHKVFSFETRKSEETNQLLVRQEYVLVFINKTEKPLTVNGNFWLERNSAVSKN